MTLLPAEHGASVQIVDVTASLANLRGKGGPRIIQVKIDASDGVGDEAALAKTVRLK